MTSKQKVRNGEAGSKKRLKFTQLLHNCLAK